MRRTGSRTIEAHGTERQPVLWLLVSSLCGAQCGIQPEAMSPQCSGHMGESGSLLGSMLQTKMNLSRSLWWTSLMSFYPVTVLMCLHHCGFFFQAVFVWKTTLRSRDFSLSFSSQSLFSYHHAAHLSLSKTGTFFYNVFTMIVLVFSQCSINISGLNGKDYSEESSWVACRNAWGWTILTDTRYAVDLGEGSIKSSLSQV